MPENAKNNNDELISFLSGFQKLVGQIGEEAIKATNDQDEIAVIKAFVPSVVNQVTELGNHVISIFESSSLQQKSEVLQVLKVGSGNTLVNGAKGIFPSIGSLVGKLGLDRIIKEIKKVIIAILEVFGIKLPKWLDGIINLIDEIIAFILSGGSPKIATILSIQEQNYLAELTQLSKLQQANQFKYMVDEDED